MKNNGLFLAFALLLGGCATTTTAQLEQSLSPQLQAQYDACEPAIRRYCRDYTQGDTERALQCRRDSRRDYATFPTDAQRTALLREQGCQI